MLHDPSVYIINRKSLLVNKPHVYYNEDSSNVHCAPLSTNVLKWSEGFLGDCMTIEPVCRYEEPIRNVVLNADYPKISIVELFMIVLGIHHFLIIELKLNLKISKFITR